MKKALAVAALLGAFAIGAALGAQGAGGNQQMDPVKKADILSLMAVAGVDKVGASAVDKDIASMKKLLPSVPDYFWEKVRAEADPEQLTDRLVVLYDRSLSHEDIKEFLAFYRTPLGQKMLEVMPTVQANTYQIVQQWNAAFAMKARSALLAAGYITAQPGAPGAPAQGAPAPAPPK